MTTKAWQRAYDRAADALRPLRVEPDIQPQAYASLLIGTGATQVVCAVSLEETVPPFLENGDQGWVTAEYAMLPGATSSRNRRETAGRSGRSMEIQRLIGRSLRAALDLKALGQRTITLDCDVIQADGGTRTASITGAYVALYDAITGLMEAGKLETNPIQQAVASVSVGIYQGTPVCDLDYAEDSNAETDMNVVMNSDGAFIEVQGTAEGHPFDQQELLAMLDLARNGINTLFEAQRCALNSGQ